MSFFNDVKRSKEKRTTGIAGKYMKDYDSLFGNFGDNSGRRRKNERRKKLFF